MAMKQAGKKEACSPRTIRHYPVALRFELKALAATKQMSLEELEIKILKYGLNNSETIFVGDKLGR